MVKVVPGGFFGKQFTRIAGTIAGFRWRIAWDQ